MTTHREAADDSTSSEPQIFAELVPDQTPAVAYPLLIGTTTQGLVIERINNEFSTYLGHHLSELIRRAPDLHLVVVPLAPSPYLGFAQLLHGRPATHVQRPPASVIDEAAPDLSRLSARERDIVSRLTAGDRAPAIAEALHLSQSTVRNHLPAVFRKLRIHSPQELIDLLRNRADTSGTD